MKTTDEIIDELIEASEEEDSTITWEVDSLASMKGTRKVGTLQASYPELTAVFGEENPINTALSDEEATRGWWRIVWSDGLVAEIYDWKQYDKDFEEVTEWNVASKSVGALFRLQDILKGKTEALGTNRDYKTRDRRAVQNLRKHFARMNELIATGMDRDAASKQAYDELFVKKSKSS